MVELLHTHRYTPVLGTMSPFDLRVPAAVSVRHAMTNLRPGAILILHDGGPGRKRTIDILEALLPRIHAQGYRLVTLTELVALGESDPR
jgi:peptidoglycan/xylan/chitin deacetylase (PgdA/CDA1 family)